MVKNPPANAGATRDPGSIPGGKIPWRRKWQPAPGFLTGIFHGQKSLTDYSHRVTKSWTQPSTHTTHTQTHPYLNLV